ncbi:MFS general substrate transporter [Mycena latifolia]|nr:MFS general substrate transporter [Mycena latifolia]
MLSRPSRSLLCFSIGANVLCAGGVFMFPLFSPVLAQQVKLTQPQLTSIVLAGMAGQYPCTPLVGKIVDSHGPWLCSLLASLLFSLAFGCFSYQVDQMLQHPNQQSQSSVYVLVLLFALAGFGTVFSYFSSLFAATRNFPAYPGVASGTVMALFGLSPLFLSFVASSFFTNGVDKPIDLVKFLVFLAILSGVVHIIGAMNLRVPNNPLPIVVPSEADETTALLQDTRSTESGSALDLLRDPYFWVLFVLLSVTLGPCEMIMSNVGTIVLSLPSAPPSLVPSGAGASAQVKILAIANTITRLLTGPIADFLSPIVASAPHINSSKKHYISRAAFLLGVAVVLALTFLWMEVAVSQADLWVLSVGTGIAYGAGFTVLPSIITSVWGVQNAGRNFGIVVYAPLIGTTIFSYLYAFISAYHTPADDFCRGPSCWQFTFWISAGSQLVAIFCGLVLWRGWKGLL